MVEYTSNYNLELDNIFASLSDPVRRDILQRLAEGVELSVSDIARVYDMTLAAVSKHLKVLEKAHLIIKRRQGKQQLIQIHPQSLEEANEYLEKYNHLWEKRFAAMDKILAQEKAKAHKTI